MHVYNFIRNCQNIFLYHFSFSTAKHKRSSALWTYQDLVMLDFLKFFYCSHSSMYIGISHDFNLVFLMTYDVEYLFIFLSAIQISSLKYLFKSFTYFKNQIVFLLLSFYFLYIYWIQNLRDLQIFSLSIWLSLSSS